MSQSTTSGTAISTSNSIDNTSSSGITITDDDDESLIASLLGCSLCIVFLVATIVTIVMKKFAEWKVRRAPRVLRMAVVSQSSVKFGKKRVFLHVVGTINYFMTITAEVATSKKHGSSVHQRLMMVTCVIQLFTLVLFIAAVDATSSPVACSFLAILLHYLLLCPTVAMVLDATLLRRKVFKVLQCTWRKEIRLRRAIVSVFVEILLLGLSTITMYVIRSYGHFEVTGSAWSRAIWPVKRAIPLLVIFVAFGSTKVQQHGSSGEFKYCSVNTYSMLIFGIATPIAVAVSYNVVMLLMVARIQQQKSKEMPLRIINSPTLEQWKTSLKTCMFLTAQLGVTWILGLLALLTQAGELHYTFAVLNVTQGFAIFLLTLRSKEGTLDMAAESAAFSRRVQAASLHLITVFTNDGARIVNRNPMVECRL